MNSENLNGSVGIDDVPVKMDCPINAFYPIDTRTALEDLIERYGDGANGPLEVSFRDLVPWVYGGTRAGHYLHSYPAKLLPQIAHFFLANDVLCPYDGVVLDPFSGSGTVALETILSGRDAYYCDVNPFARFLTKAKTTPVTADDVEAALRQVQTAYCRHTNATLPDVVNLGYWYDLETSQHLSRLKHAIYSIQEVDHKNLLLVAFSTLSKQLSRANPRFSVPVRLKVDGQHVNVEANAEEVWHKYLKIVQRVKIQISSMVDLKDIGKSKLVGENVLKLGRDWPETAKGFGDIDLVITSPPYAGAQKYVRSTSLSLGWLDQSKSSELKKIENMTLGREHLPKALSNTLPMTSIAAANEVISNIASENSSRAAIASIFLSEMEVAANRIVGSLKPGGYAVVVMADNTICGRSFSTTAYISELFLKQNTTKVLEVKDEIVTRSLQTKRAKSSSSISHETITIFRKGQQDG